MTLSMFMCTLILLMSRFRVQVLSMLTVHLLSDVDVDIDDATDVDVHNANDDVAENTNSFGCFQQMTPRISKTKTSRNLSFKMF